MVVRMIIIDASDTILGRLASYVAKKALNSEEEIIIVNCEKTVISGNKENILERYKEKRDRGDRYKGPFYPKYPDRIVRRTIRGMLPYKTKRGKEALKRIKTYIGTPEEFKDKEKVRLEEFSKETLKDMKYIYLEEVSRYLGAKINV